MIFLHLLVPDIEYSKQSSAYSFTHFLSDVIVKIKEVSVLPLMQEYSDFQVHF